MNARQPTRLTREDAIRAAWNRHQNCNCLKVKVNVGARSHEFDLYEHGAWIGGITTAKYHVGNGRNTNTACVDRGLGEVLWLTLHQGPEARVLVFTDLALAQAIIARLGGAGVNPMINVYQWNEQTFQAVGQI